MTTLKNFSHFLNPFNRLGKKEYSIIFPFTITVIVAIFLEIYTQQILKDPNITAAAAVVIFLGLVTYFAFHDGIRGGITASLITIFYYIYITYSRHFGTERFIRDIETSLALGVLYLSLAMVIGGLKQKTDELIESEAGEKNRLQTIIQQMPAGVIVLDQNGKVTHANKQLELISGYKIAFGSILGKDKILIPETYNVKSSNSPLNQVLKAGKTLMKREYLIKRKDGKERYIQISASPVFGKNNQIIAAIAIITDIHQQKEHEQKKDDFVNIASHELKTPITSMKLYMNALSSRVIKYKDRQITQIVSNLVDQTDRLQELINDLLDVSRLQTGKMTFTKETFQLNGFLKETIESLKAIAKEHKIIFLEKNLLVVSGDKFRINQVITNLLTNAIKYSDPSSDIIVTIKKAKDKAIISVKDFGIGISEDEQKKIFSRLYRVTDTREKTFPGLGIGLYISKQIVKRHKGNIWVESEKGKGSTFFFSLPIV